MLSITNNNCTSFTTDDPTLYIVGGLPILNYTVTVTHNCETIFTSPTFETTPEPLDITYADFGFDTKLCDGPYSFEYLINYRDGTKIKDTACYLLDCTLKCTVAEEYNDSKNEEILRLYEVLKIAVDCSDCNCTMLCDIFNELNQVKPNVELCGCSST